MVKTGILSRAVESKEENRGASVEEAKNLWQTAKTVDEKTNTNTAQTLEQLLDNLENQNLITSDEKNTIKETGKVTIGNKTIIFEKRAELESRIISMQDDIENETIYYIEVNFKNNSYDIYARNILEGKTADEMMDMFVESEKYYDSDYYEEKYPGREIDKDLVLEEYGVESLLELAQDDGFDTIEEFLIDWEAVKPEEFQSFEKVEGEITAPDGNIVQVNPYRNLKYKITEDATYTFLGETSDGLQAKTDVVVTIGNEFKLIGDNSFIFILVNGYNEKVDILEEYEPKCKVEGIEEELDLIPAIDGMGRITLRKVEGKIPSSGFINVYLTINGKKIEFSGEYELLY